MEQIQWIQNKSKADLMGLGPGEGKGTLCRGADSAVLKQREVMPPSPGGLTVPTQGSTLRRACA